jgi:hypothetical protein
MAHEPPPLNPAEQWALDPAYAAVKTQLNALRARIDHRLRHDLRHIGGSPGGGAGGDEDDGEAWKARTELLCAHMYLAVGDPMGIDLATRMTWDYELAADLRVCIDRQLRDEVTTLAEILSAMWADTRWHGPIVASVQAGTGESEWLDVNTARGDVVWREFVEA